MRLHGDHAGVKAQQGSTVQAMSCPWRMFTSPWEMLGQSMDAQRDRRLRWLRWAYYTSHFSGVRHFWLIPKSCTAFHWTVKGQKARSIPFWCVLQIGAKIATNDNFIAGHAICKVYALQDGFPMLYQSWKDGSYPGFWMVLDPCVHIHIIYH